MNAGGGLEFAASRSTSRRRSSTAGPRRRRTRRRSSPTRAALSRRRHRSTSTASMPDRLGGAARQRHRRHRLVSQARPQPAAHRHVPGRRPDRRRGAHPVHRLGRRALDLSWFSRTRALTTTRAKKTGGAGQPPEASLTFCLPAEIHGIIARSSAPVFSIGCCAARLAQRVELGATRVGLGHPLLGELARA